MTHPKRQTPRVVGLLAAAGVLAIGLAAGSPGAAASVRYHFLRP